MRDSEHEPFYEDIAHVIQNTKKANPTCEIRTRDLCGTLLKQSVLYRTRPTAHWFKAVHIRLL